MSSREETASNDSAAAPLHGIVMRPEWVRAIAKAASSIRFTAHNWEWVSDAAREESISIAETLTEIENEYIRATREETGSIGMRMRVDDCNVQIHPDGSRATVFRVATGYIGRGYATLDEVPTHLRQDLYEVPGNDLRDAFFCSRQGALQMIGYLSR